MNELIEALKEVALLALFAAIVCSPMLLTWYAFIGF